MWTTLLLAQAVAGPVLPLAPQRAVARHCPADLSPDEIVVCARDPDAYRLRAPVAPVQGPALPKAAVRVGRTSLAAEAEQAQIAGGQQSQRLMLRWKVPLGGRKSDAL